MTVKAVLFKHEYESHDFLTLFYEIWGGGVDSGLPFLCEFCCCFGLRRICFLVFGLWLIYLFGIYYYKLPRVLGGGQYINIHNSLIH